MKQENQVTLMNSKKKKLQKIKQMNREKENILPKRKKLPNKQINKHPNCHTKEEHKDSNLDKELLSDHISGSGSGGPDSDGDVANSLWHHHKADTHAGT